MKTAWHLGHRIRFAMAPAATLARWAALERPLKPTKPSWRGPARPSVRPASAASAQPHRSEPCRARRQYPLGDARPSRRRRASCARMSPGQPPRDRQGASITSSPPVAEHEASITPSSNGRAATCIRTRWKASFRVFKRGLVGIYQRPGARPGRLAERHDARGRRPGHDTGGLTQRRPEEAQGSSRRISYPPYSRPDTEGAWAIFRFGKEYPQLI